MHPLTNDDVKLAAERIAGVVRPVTVAPADPYVFGSGVHLALEFMQHTGSFKARGAANLVAAYLAAGTMPAAGIITSTGRNADLGFAWAARRYGVPVTAFLPETAAPVMIDRLRALGADVQVGADHTAAAREFAERTGAVDAYAADTSLAAAGSGTLLPELVAAIPSLDTVVVAVGAGGMFAGITAAADHHGVRVVAAEPQGCPALHSALAAGRIVDVRMDSVAADSLGSLHVLPAAFHWARSADVRSVLVEDPAIVRARRLLWEHHRLVVEHGSAATLAALICGAYRPADGEQIAVVLCGANTDPGDLVRG